MTINPKETETAVFHQYLLSSVSPRPIALASTIDSNGHVNLSPFSFFNCFSINPPILVFSPSRRVRDNTTKHTLENILETKEVVIHIVNFSMAEQMSLSSVEFEKGVKELMNLSKQDLQKPNQQKYYLQELQKHLFHLSVV